MRSQVEAARKEVDRSVGVETRCEHLREVGENRKETEQLDILRAYQDAEGSEVETFVDAVTEQSKLTEEDTLLELAADHNHHDQNSDQVETGVAIPLKKRDGGNLVAKDNSAKPTSSKQKCQKLKALKEKGKVDERKVEEESEEQEGDLESRDVSRCVSNR